MTESQSPSPPPLDQVLTLAARGDAQAWKTIVDTYTKRIFGLLYHQCRNPDLAEEITQATFVQVVRHLPQYQEQGRFESWIFRIAINLLRDEIRRRSRQAQTTDFQTTPSSAESSAHAACNLADVSCDPCDALEQNEQLQQLRHAVQQLSPADQQILHLRHTAGLTFSQIAQTLNQPLGTILARSHRALDKLRQILSPAATDHE